MRRHFSNRGEALAEVAAAKMMTHRTTKNNVRLRQPAQEERRAWAVESTTPRSDFAKDLAK